MEEVKEFRNSRKEKFTLEEVRERIIKIMKKNPSDKFALWVGTDSQSIKKKRLYVTAIVLYQIGHGGNIFYRKNWRPKDFNIVQQIYQETQRSLDIIQVFEDLETMKQIDAMEVHIDAGKNGRSRDAIEACIGYVTGMGFIPRIKPDAPCASYTADRYTK